MDPRSGHMQEATSGCISKWNNKLMFLSLSYQELKNVSKKMYNLNFSTNRTNWQDTQVQGGTPPKCGTNQSARLTKGSALSITREPVRLCARRNLFGP